jgi:hypothetical protein
VRVVGGFLRSIRRERNQDSLEGDENIYTCASRQVLAFTATASVPNREAVSLLPGAVSRQEGRWCDVTWLPGLTVTWEARTGTYRQNR